MNNYWVDVNTGTPFNGNDVLIVTEHKDINDRTFYDKELGSYENGQWYSHAEGRVNNVVLWMYIPDFPWDIV